MLQQNRDLCQNVTELGPVDTLFNIIISEQLSIVIERGDKSHTSVSYSISLHNFTTSQLHNFTIIETSIISPVTCSGAPSHQHDQVMTDVATVHRFAGIGCQEDASVARTLRYHRLQALAISIICPLDSRRLYSASKHMNGTLNIGVGLELGRRWRWLDLDGAR